MGKQCVPDTFLSCGWGQWSPCKELKSYDFPLWCRDRSDSMDMKNSSLSPQIFKNKEPSIMLREAMF